MWNLIQHKIDYILGVGAGWTAYAFTYLFHIDLQIQYHPFIQETIIQLIKGTFSVFWAVTIVIAVHRVKKKLK